jgi:long-chain acyl-CoA synthetase
MPTLSQRFVKCATNHASKAAMSLLDAGAFENTTFDSMLRQVCSVAYRIEKAGVNPGDRVAIIGESHPNWAIAYLAILHAGAVVTPLDPSATALALASFLMDSGARLAFVSPTCLDKVRDACADLRRTPRIVLLQSSTKNDEFDAFGDWAISSHERVSQPAPVRPTDLALLIYTSGTAGRSKAVPLNHGNIETQIDAVEKIMRVTDDEIVFSILPLFHAYAQIINLWLAATIGAHVVYLNQLGIAEIEDGLKRSRATALIGVPQLWYLFHKKIFDAVNRKPALVRWLFKAMLKANGAMRDYARINLGSFFFRPIHLAFGGRLRLAVSGGAMFDETIASDFHRLGFTILQGYGLTETAGAITATRFDDNRIGSVGKPFGATQVKINDPDTRGVGEVFIRGPSVMAGYYRNEQATAEAFTADGWFRSGDLGYYDQDGNLFIVGRRKDVIILPSGKNVFPEDIESHYEGSPLIKEICVLGRRGANGYNGSESLCAFVVPNFDFLRTQRISNPAEWIRWELEDLGRELPEYQRVHDFVFRPEPLPRTTTRKIRRFELQHELEPRSLFGSNGQNTRKLVLNADEGKLMSSSAGRVVSAVIKQQIADLHVLHPLHNLEIDLRMDSLARIECITNLEHALEIHFEPDEIASALSVGDLVGLASRKSGDASLVRAEPLTRANAHTRHKSHWQEILTNSGTQLTELKPLFKRKRVKVLIAYLVLRLIYLVAKVFFGIEVKGREVFKKLEPPYLLCPNHQSYIDAFIICSVLPKAVLEQIIHVGASRYFTGFLSSQLARLINVVPIDPDVHLLRAMRIGAEVLRHGRILNVYPEGRRSFDGELGVFKKGAAILATELKVPIVPVALDGTYRIWPRGSSRIRLAQVKISFGEPIVCNLTAEGTNSERQYDAFTARIKETVARLLKEMRHD